MNYQQLRQKYPKFLYTGYSFQNFDNKLKLEFRYHIPPDHTFVHKVTFDNLNLTHSKVDEGLVFLVGLAEIFSYWKTTCSPQIQIQAGHLSPDQINFWHKLLIKGMGQYFYENQIDFTAFDFLKITPSGPKLTTSSSLTKNGLILVPIGGGKDSIVTAEILKSHYPIKPIIVYPATAASERISAILINTPPIIVRRSFDKQLLKMKTLEFLDGHVPYSAILAFIFLLTAQIENTPFIAVSNERSSNEGNVSYLGHEINHQYSKSAEFETDLNIYIQSLGLDTTYFSFLRPLYELQIAKLFSQMPQYFSQFRSCNKNQQQDSWCGQCPKCLSISLALGAWVGEAKIKEIMGTNPLTNPANVETLESMTNPAKVKPFECITTTEEANICLEFIQNNQTPKVKEFLSRFGDSPNTPPQFFDILKKAYANS